MSDVQVVAVVALAAGVLLAIGLVATEFSISELRRRIQRLEDRVDQ